MEDKTSELRDIFVETTGSDTVTERQEESRGSIADGDRDVDERVGEVIDEMRERYDFRSDLDDDALRAVARGYFDGDDDAALAEAVGADEGGVVAARLDLHLLRDDDRESEMPFDRLRSMVADGADVEAVAEAFVVSEERARDAFRVASAAVESRRVNDRFRDEFAELLTDDDLSSQFARDAREDGLEDATEDLETDVSF